MNEKITAILTLAVMGVAFWYGFSGSDEPHRGNDKSIDLMTIIPESVEENNQSSSNEAIDVDTNSTDNEALINQFDVEVIESKPLINSTTECSLNPSKTDGMTFKNAFKYYRTCNGNKSDFIWNGKLFLTSYKEEIAPTAVPQNTLTDKQGEKEIIEISVSN